MGSMESGDLHESATLGDLDKLESLIENSEPDAINAYYDSGETLLFTAAVSNTSV